MISSYNQIWKLEKDLKLIKSNIDYFNRAERYKREIQIELSKLINREERMAMVAGILAPTLYEKLIGIAVQNHIFHEEFNSSVELLTLSFPVNQILKELSDNEDFLSNALILEIFDILLTGLNNRKEMEVKKTNNIRSNLTQINYHDPFKINFENYIRQISNNYSNPLNLKELLYESINFGKQEFPAIIAYFDKKFSPDVGVKEAFLAHLISELNIGIRENFSEFDQTYQSALSNFLSLYFK
jgi:hypothetical protein